MSNENTFSPEDQAKLDRQAEHAQKLAANLAPDMARDAARYQMILRLAAEDDADFTDEPGPLTLAAREISSTLDEEFKDAQSVEQLSRMLDRLIEKFGSE